MNTEYKVDLEIFEGPLDLLLYLIKKDEIDIYDIPIEKITKQYLDYLALMQMLDLNIAGEFFVMAATLMYIKSRMLLPPEERPQEEEVDEDPRMDLVRQLLEYKKFKDAAEYLHDREILQEKVFVRNAPVDMPEAADNYMMDVNIFDLISAFSQALQKVEKPDDIKEVAAEEYTVAEKVATLKDRLQQESRFSLTQLFGNMKSHLEIVVTFLALLELIRLKGVKVYQPELFAEIVVEGVNA